MSATTSAATLDRAGVQKQESAQQKAKSARRPASSEPGKARRVSDEKKPIGKRNKEMGRKGEDAAARFLEARGYEIVERNWTCPFGEADIVARDDTWLVFVEVKTRRSIDKGFPSDAVDSRKRSKYERIALAYAADHSCVDVPVRFDIVSIVVIGKDKAMIRHHMNAFTR